MGSPVIHTPASAERERERERSTDVRLEAGEAMGHSRPSAGPPQSVCSHSEGHISLMEPENMRAYIKRVFTTLSLRQPLVMISGFHCQLLARLLPTVAIICSFYKFSLGSYVAIMSMCLLLTTCDVVSMLWCLPLTTCDVVIMLWCLPLTICCGVCF